MFYYFAYIHDGHIIVIENTRFISTQGYIKYSHILS